MPRLPFKSPLVAAAIALSCFLAVYAAVTLLGSDASRFQALVVAGCGGLGGVLGWAWQVFKSEREAQDR